MRTETHASEFTDRIYKTDEFRRLLDLPSGEFLVNVHVRASEVTVVTTKREGR